MLVAAKASRNPNCEPKCETEGYPCKEFVLFVAALLGSLGQSPMRHDLSTAPIAFAIAAHTPRVRDGPP